MPVPRRIAILGACVLAGALSATLVACVPEPEVSQPAPSATSPTAAPSDSPSDAASPDVTLSPSPLPSASVPGTSTVFVNVITADVTGTELEATAMVADLVEEGGSCTLVATKGTTRRTATATTTPGPASTYCALMTVPVTELRPGDWKITVTYVSALHSGTSSEVTVVVP